MRRLLTSLASIVIVTLTLQAAAQDFPAQVVSAVRCEGLTRVSEQLIRAQLEVKSGQPYNSRAVSRDIRRLYDLDYFANIIADVQTVAGQVILTYIFEEKRFIDEVKIIGNKKVRTRDIRGAVSWRTGDAFLEDGYEQERDAVLNLYKQKGYPNTTVDIIVDEVAPGRVRVTYNIDEGKKARIKRISFEGNEVLSKRKLNKLMKTGRAWWFVGGKYDEAKFEADLQNILKEYGNFGRLEADVVKVDLIYPDNARRLLITISLAEGPEYAVEQLDVANNEVFDDDEIMRIVKVHPGDVHNTGQLEKDTDLIRKGYEDSGYINANVTPQVTVDPENKKTQVLYAVEEGDLKYVREIKITGNNVTKDEVIRRDLLLVPGERFDGTALQASQRRLENSQYFQEVRFTREPTDDERFANLLLDVDEGKTGNFNFGVGYSTEERLGGFAELRLDNFDLGNWPSFSGGGQQFRTRISLGDVRSQYSLSFTDPEFLGYPLAFGFDVFDEYYEYTGGVEFDERTQGAQLRFGKLLSPYVNARTSLRYDNVDISHLPYFASRSLRRERGAAAPSAPYGESPVTRSTTTAIQVQVQSTTSSSNSQASEATTISTNSSRTPRGSSPSAKSVSGSCRCAAAPAGSMTTVHPILSRSPIASS